MSCCWVCCRVTRWAKVAREHQAGPRKARPEKAGPEVEMWPLGDSTKILSLRPFCNAAFAISGFCHDDLLVKLEGEL